MPKEINMLIWSERTFKVEYKGFEDGLNDARHQAVDGLAYRIHTAYRNGVDVAQQLMTMFGTAWSEGRRRPMERAGVTPIAVNGRIGK
jgi:hypothetical protein